MKKERDDAQKALDDAKSAGVSAEVIAEKLRLNWMQRNSKRLEHAHKMVDTRLTKFSITMLKESQ